MSSPVKVNKDVNMEDSQQLIDVGGFEIKTTNTGQLDNTYLVDTPAVDLESTPRDWEEENGVDYEMVVNGELPPIIEGIPPPMQFADTQDGSEDAPPDVPSRAPPGVPSGAPPQIPVSAPPVIPTSAPSVSEESVPVTNIDDLLGLDEDTSELPTVQYSDQFNGLQMKSTEVVETVNEISNSGGQAIDLLLDFASDTPAMDQPVNSLPMEIDGTALVQTDIADVPGEDNVTSLQVTSIDDFLSIGNVTQIPVVDETPNTDENSSQSTQSHVTTKSVNQTIVTTVDVASESDIQVTSAAPVSASINLDSENKSNSAVIEVNGNVIKKSTVITVKSERKVKSSSPLHFVPPVQASVKDANGEEIIQPMKMKKENGGLRLFEEGAAETVKSERRKVDPDAKSDLADILLKLTRTSEDFIKKSAGDSPVIEEENIVPTKTSREDAKMVLGVFEKWLSGGGKTTSSPFKKMVVDVMETKQVPKVTKIRLGSSTPLTVIPPTVENNDKSEVITPVLMRKDNKGVRSFETGSANSSPGYKPRVLDEAAKKDLAEIMSGLSKSYEKTYVGKKQNDSPVVQEREIVPEKISKEDAQTLMNVFANWLKKDEKPKANPFRKLVSNVIDALDDEPSEDVPSKEDKPVREERHTMEEVLTVTKDENTTVIKQEEILIETKTQVESDIIVPTKNSSAFALPKSSLPKEVPKDKTDSAPQPPQPKVAPVPAPKPSAAEPQRSTQDISVQLRNPASPRLAPRSVNRFSTGSLPPLNVSKAPPRISGFKNQGLQFTPAKPAKPEYQKMRREDGPFQVDVLKGIVGLGLKLHATPEGFTQVGDIQKNSPVAKNGQIKVGDYVLSINTTTLTGQSDGRIQQVLRLLPRGLAKIVVSAVPPSDAEIPSGASDAHASSGDTSPGATSPFGVRLGAKPFNTAESRSATVTSPLMRDSGFFEKRTSFSKQQNGGDNNGVKKPHISTIDVSKLATEVRQEKHVSKIDVSKSQEDSAAQTVTRKDVQEEMEQKAAGLPKIVKSQETVGESVVAMSKEPATFKPLSVQTVTETETTITKRSEQREHEKLTGLTEKTRNEETELKSEMLVEEKVTVTESQVKSEVLSKDNRAEREEGADVKLEEDGPKQQPVKAPRPAPRQQAQPTEKTDDKELVAVSEKLVEVKTPPKVPPKPRARSKVNDTSPVPQRKFISNVNVESHTEEKEKAHSRGFVSTISVEKELSPPRISNSAKFIQNDDIDEGVVADVKPKSADKTPPPVAPKPRRTSSGSSDVSSSSILSDDLHFENEVEGGLRRRRHSSNSSAKSAGSMKSDRIPEEPYVSRRKSENAPEKRSVKEKMAAFEAFQKNEEESGSASSNFVIPKRKVSSSSQGPDGNPQYAAEAQRTKSRSESTSSTQKDIQEEDGVFIVSRISIKSPSSPDEPTTPKSPEAPASPLSPDNKAKMNAALMPKSRTVEPKPRTALEPKPRTSHLEAKTRTPSSESKTKPEETHHHAVPKTSSSIFKPTGLERLKNLAGHKTDSGEVAHSSSPEGVYKIGPVKMNSALSPRKSSSSEDSGLPGHTYASSPHKLQSGEGRKLMSTSRLTDHTHVDVSQSTKESAIPDQDVPETKLIVQKVQIPNVQKVVIEEDTSVPVNEKETENVKIQMEIVKDQIQISPPEVPVYEYKDEGNQNKEEVQVSQEEQVERIVSVNEGFAEKVVEASIEAAKKELVKQKSDEIVDKNETESTQGTDDKIAYDEVMPETAEIETEQSVEIITNTRKPKDQGQNVTDHAENIVSENDIQLDINYDVQATTEHTSKSDEQKQQDADENELEIHASEIVAATIETVKKRLGDETEAESSPPPLPGSIPPPLPSGPPPPVPIEDQEPESLEQMITSTITHTEEEIVTQTASQVKAAPAVVNEVPEDLKESAENKAEAPPPLPSHLPPIPQMRSRKVETQEDDNKWVEEIEKIAVQESKFDLLINFDSKEKVVLDQTTPQTETPSSDSDSGVVLQMSSPSSAIADVADIETESQAKSDVVEETVQEVTKLVSTSVEPLVESAVGAEGSRGRTDTGTDSGVESSGEVTNKTVTVQYSSHTLSNEQDSFSSVDSLHDITPSVSSKQTTVTVEKITEKVAPVSHAEKSTNSNNISVSQVSKSRDSPPRDALKDSDITTLEATTEKIFSSTPTKDSPKSKESVVDANVSSIQLNSSSLSASQSLSMSKSNVLNKSFSVSPKSKSSLSKRKWRLLSCGSGEGPADLSLSELTNVTDDSFLSKDELSTLISQANQSMDKTGMSLEDEIVVVVLTKDTPEQELGIDLRDGILRSKVVSSLKPGSPAEKEQRVQVKDCLLSVNSKSVEDMSAEDVKKLLQEPSPQVSLVLSRRGTPPSISNGHSAAEASLNGNGAETGSPATQQGPGVFEVVMKKGVTGVGFCLEGGKGSPKGDMPILIKRIFKGGPAEKCGQLQVKDEILKVNDTDFTALRHYEAWNHLKFLPDGDVRIVIQRK